MFFVHTAQEKKSKTHQAPLILDSWIFLIIVTLLFSKTSDFKIFFSVHT